MKACMRIWKQWELPRCACLIPSSPEGKSNFFSLRLSLVLISPHISESSIALLVQVKAKIGVPGPQHVDVEEIKKAFPYGNVEIKIVHGGLRWHSGIILPGMGDPPVEAEDADSSDDDDQLAGKVFAKDDMITAIAAVRIGF